MIVLDASAALEVLLRTPVGHQIENRIFASDESLHAPHLIDLEMVAVLRRYVLSGVMAAARADAAIGDFACFPVERYPHELFVERIWQLRHNVTAYDAAYVALAEVLDAPLITADGPLARSSGHHVHMEVFAAQ